MDLIDKKILCELDADCSRSFSQIAKKLKINRNVIAYRIKKLEDEKIIKNYICSLNLGLLGYKTYKFYLRVNTSDIQTEKNFISFLQKNPTTIHFLRLEGSWDYSLTIATKDISNLDNFFTELKTSFPNFIRKYSFSLLVYSKIFKINKLLLGENKTSLKYERYSSEESLVKLDSKDELILKTLANHSNISIVDLSEQTKLSLDIIKYRLKNLEKNVINSYRAIFDLNKLSYFHYTLLLETYSLTEKEEANILLWCQLNKKVAYLNKRVGSFDFEINFLVSNISELSDFLIEFKERFGKVVNSHEIILTTDILKLNYIPFG